MSAHRRYGFKSFSADGNAGLFSCHINFDVDGNFKCVDLIFYIVSKIYTIVNNLYNINSLQLYKMDT